jgi:hypothetical protein
MCSFCGKSQREVRKLIAGPSVYICDECIGLCNDIIVEEIDREKCADALRASVSEGVRTDIARILERGMPAAVSVRHDLRHRIIEDSLRRRAAGEPPDEPLWPPRRLAADWNDLHEIVTRANARPSESGEGGPLEAEPPEWVRPIAERLSRTLEVLDGLVRSLEKPGLEEVRRLRPSVDAAGEKLREAREMLLARAGPRRSHEVD